MFLYERHDFLYERHKIAYERHFEILNSILHFMVKNEHVIKQNKPFVNFRHYLSIFVVSLYFKTNKMTMIKAVIVDDEQLAIESLQWEINNFTDEVKIIEAFTNPKDAISGINYLKPDLVFLDIEMPEIDGFQLLQAIEYRQFDLIITTAYNQYAIQAFKANAIDYLLKPIDPGDLVQAIEKVRQRQISQQSTKNIEAVLSKLVSGNMQSNKKIALGVGNKVVMVEPKDIMYCKSDGSYTNVVMVDNQTHLISKNIGHIAEALPDDKFLRVHKSYLVNIDVIKEINKRGNGEIILESEIIVPISRSYKHQVFEALNVI